MKVDEGKLDSVAESLCNWAFSDSHVKLDKIALKDVLREDFGYSACRLPTEKECELIVTGGDEGEVPEEIRDNFSQTCEFIGSYWA